MAEVNRDISTIQTFFAKAAQRQFARDFLFRVKQINLANAQGFDGEDQLVYARSANLPGRDIEDKLVNYFGQTFHVPGKSSYPGSDSYSIEFYHDESCDLRSQFELASRIIFDNDTSTGEYGMPGAENVIVLEAIDRGLNPVKQIVLMGVSIRNVGEITYEIADGTGEVKTFPVTFAYHWYNMY